MRYILYISLALLLAACAGVKNQPAETTQADQGVVMEPTPNTAKSDNKAVIALLDKAQSDIQAGKRGSAGAALERALRIEPRNPWLWQKLALIRLDEGRYAQAITLAKKSNSFSVGQPRLQSANWLVIGQARTAQGDSTGANEAFKRASDLSSQAP